MASRQIDFYRRLIARKALQSSEDAALSLRIFSHCSSDETNILHSTKLPSLQPLYKLPVEHPCRIVDNDNVKENYQKPKNILYGSTKLWATISERTVLRDASTLSAARAIRGKPVLPSGVRWISHSTMTSSPATATQRVPNNEEEQSEGKVSEQRKIEPSPEECDQAVAGLSSVKAKAKQAQELLKKDESIAKRFWAMLIGIGPALRAVASMSREDWARKLSQWKGHFFEALQHYWMGTKLLWVDVRISFRLLLKLASGKSLSRRERQQLTRTTADIFRLVPFAVFIIVPFMEFLLPVFLKLFPNMLPSTFQDKMKEEEKLKRRLNARIEYAKFLQDTVKEMAREIKTSRSGELKQTAEDLDTFLSKVRTGAKVSNDEILGFAKLFNDELTLDNVSRPRLVNMCKYMGIKPYGTDAYLRYMLRSKLARIKEDDRMIQSEGFESLSEAELRQACRDRGMLGLLSVEEMRQQLRDWLDLSLNHSVPSSLLILSRAFTVSGKVKPEEAVQATLSSLPDELVDSVGVTAFPSEDSVADRRRKLEYLEMQEDLIKEEEKREKEEQARLEEEAELNQIDRALQEMNVSTEGEVQELARAKAIEKPEQLCNLSRALAVLASASSVSAERAEFLRLVNKEIELYNSIVDKESEGVRWALALELALALALAEPCNMNQCLFTNTITPRPLHTSINYSTSQIGNGSHTFLAGNVRSNSRTYALLQPTPTQVEQSGGGGGGGGAAAACRVKLQTLNGCKLGIGRYPDFEYNAQGGSATGIGIGIEQVDVEFDIHSLYIPPLTYQTTKLLGVPLPPFLTITILPQIFQGIIHQDTGKVELQLTADFNLSMLSLYKPPPLQVETVLTTEEVKTKGEKGQRLDSQGFCKLVGVATILPVNDSFLNAFLDLPTHCIARLSAQILISTT